MKYLVETKEFERVLGVKKGSKKMELEAFCDAGYGDDPENRKSTSGGILSLGGYPIHSYTKQQSTVSTSTTEAEYQALSMMVSEVKFVRLLLEELGYHQQLPTDIYEDNQSARALVYSTKYHERSKHIDIKHHQVREAAEDGIITVKYISTNDQLADIMTKALNGKRFHEFRKQLGIQKRGVLVSS